VSKLGFFGEGEQFLWGITHTETLTLWNLAEVQLAHARSSLECVINEPFFLLVQEQLVQRFDSIREGFQARGVALDYLLGCSPDPNGTLALFGGSFR
jgi:hypothetical protein